MKLLLLINGLESAYVSRIKPMLGTSSVFVTTAVPQNKFEVFGIMEKNGFDGAIVSNWEAASKIMEIKIKAPGEDGQGKTLYDYQGSCIVSSSGKRIVVINALQTLVSIPYQPFVTRTFIEKLTAPEKWIPQTKFVWEEIKDHVGFERAKTYLESSCVIAVDIETSDNHRITEIGFCGIQINNGNYESCSFVISLNSIDALWRMRELAMLEPPKVFHNGCYDNTHLLSWRTPVNNWLFDTLGCMHSSYPELPRDLAFTAALHVRDIHFWKDEGGTGNYQDQLRYNARDVWATANTFIAWALQAPEYAHVNYCLKAPELAIAVYMGMEGIQVDLDKRQQLSQDQHNILTMEMGRIQKMTWYGFNPNSPPQVKLLFQALGAKDVKTTDAKARKKLAEKSPIAARIFASIDAWKKAAKLVSTYLEAPVLGDRMLWSFNPFGTESCRWSSAQSHLFRMEGKKYKHFGAQAQNLPPYAKKMMRAEDGFSLYEIDKKASESYCTALLSGSNTLWDAVHNSPDFHCHNCSLFFGIPFELLYDITTETVLQKPMRDLAKRVNHGANYCMGATVLVETMGATKVWEAKELLMKSYKENGNALLYNDIHSRNTPKDIAEFLLDRFHAAYPELSRKWYPAIKREVAITGLLTSPSGWTKKCFGDPINNKLDANACVAHGPQHLSVMLLNKGLRAIFDNLVCGNLRLHAQIHDSVVFSVRIGYEYLTEEMDKLLRPEIHFKGKTLVIPNDVDGPKIYWK